MPQNHHGFNRISAFSEPDLILVREKLHILRSLVDEARRRIAIVNSVVTEVAASGLLSKTVILGPVIQTQAYPPTPGGSDSGRISQAALLIPGGVGALGWDSELFSELQETIEGLEAEAWLHFRSFEE